MDSEAGKAADVAKKVMKSNLVVVLWLCTLGASSFDLGALQAKLFEKVKGTLPLQKTDFTDVYEGSTHEFGKTSWFTEVSPDKLTGVSLYSCKSAYSIDCWCGPSYDVPHSLLTMSVDDDGSCSIACDYVVRGPTPIGSDPQMIEQYYSFSGPVLSGGGKSLEPASSFSTRLLYSPVRISLKGLSPEDLTVVAENHVDRWVSWVGGAGQIAARSRGAFNARDDKLRKYFYEGEVERLVAEFGEDTGRMIAACHTGPISEAYVGGGS